MDYKLIKNDKLIGFDLTDFDKILISPGPGVAKDAGDLIQLIENNYKEKSMLGICLGYEAIGEFFGAKLSRLPEPMHGIQNRGLIVKRDSLFNGIPDSFKIGHYHSWIFNEVDIPSNLHILLKDENGLPMAFSHERYNLVGMQFHPESIMTEYGKDMISNWLNS